MFGGPIDWKARKQQTVTTSTTEAELLALQHASKELEGWKNLFNEMELDLEGDDNQIHCDNKQTVRLIQLDNPIVKTNIRHINISDMWLRQEQTLAPWSISDEKRQKSYAPGNDYYK